jgi:predicted nucleic acid-binding protein
MLASGMTSTCRSVANPVLSDTGPLYALADPSDQYHRRAVRELQLLAKEGRPVAIAYPTLAECYTLVLRRLGSTYCRSWLEEILQGSMLLNPEEADFLSGCSLLAKFRDQPLTLFDVVAAVMSRRLKTPVWTYDRHFDLLSVQRWPPRPQ